MLDEDEIRDAFRHLVIAMEPALGPWWIIGSAAVFLHGARQAEFADIDIVLGLDDARRICSSLGLKPDSKPDHPKFRSELFFTWKQTTVPIEFMAGFEFNWRGEWIPVWPRTRVEISQASHSVFVPDRNELRVLMARFGRKKDLERIALIDAVADQG